MYQVTATALIWFQSTPPLREATAAPTAARPSRPVSIHASLAGGDERVQKPEGAAYKFQSTPPLREATLFLWSVGLHGAVSIHASLAGGDLREA